MVLNKGYGGYGYGSQVENDFDVFRYIDPFIGTDKGGRYALIASYHKEILNG